MRGADSTREAVDQRLQGRQPRERAGSKAVIQMKHRVGGSVGALVPKIVNLGVPDRFVARERRWQETITGQRIDRDATRRCQEVSKDKLGGPREQTPLYGGPQEASPTQVVRRGQELIPCRDESSGDQTDSSLNR